MNLSVVIRKPFHFEEEDFVNSNMNIIVCAIFITPKNIQENGKPVRNAKRFGKKLKDSTFKVKCRKKNYMKPQKIEMQQKYTEVFLTESKVQNPGTEFRPN